MWSVECDELGTASYGNTADEAFLNIKEALSLHIETLIDVGEPVEFKEKFDAFVKSDLEPELRKL